MTKPLAMITTCRPPSSLARAIVVNPVERGARRAERRAIRGILPVRLEQRDDIVEEVGETARVIQELADGHAFDDPGVAVQVQRAVVDELENDRGDEGLHHAADLEAMVRRHVFAVSRFARPAAPSSPAANATTPGRPP
jgi:hypothetical protein